MKRVIVGLVLCLVVPMYVNANGPTIKVMRTLMSRMFQVGQGIRLSNGITVNKTIWLTDHFERTLGTEIKVAVKGQGLKKSHEVTLTNLRMPIEIQTNPQYASEFLRKATGIKGQDPAVIPGVFDKWDAVNFKTEKLLSNANTSERLRLHRMDLQHRRIHVFEEGSDIVFVFAPDDFAGTISVATFGSAALAIPLASMGDMTQNTARSIIQNEMSLWIYPAPWPSGFPDPVSVQMWNSGVWFVTEWVDDFLAHPLINQPLASMNDSFIPFLDFVNNHENFEWSGNVSELPFDFLFFGNKELRAKIEYIIEDEFGTEQVVYDVVAQQPVDILEWVAGNIEWSFLVDELEWIDHTRMGTPFNDYLLITNQSLLDDEELAGAPSAFWKSHTVLTVATNKFFVGDQIFSVQVLFTDALAHPVRLRGGNLRRSFYEVGARPIFNNLKGPGWFTIRNYDDIRCEVQIFENTILNLENVVNTSRVEWQGKDVVQVYGETPMGYRRNTFLFELNEGETCSISAQPFDPVLKQDGTPVDDYKVTIELDKAEQPFISKTYGYPSNTIPQTVIQGFEAPDSSENYQVVFVTEHGSNQNQNNKNLDYIATFIRNGRIQVKDQVNTESVRGLIGRLPANVGNFAAAAAGIDEILSAELITGLEFLFTPPINEKIRVDFDLEISMPGCQQIEVQIFDPSNNLISCRKKNLSPTLEGYEFVSTSDQQHRAVITNVYNPTAVKMKYWVIPEIKKFGPMMIGYIGFPWLYYTLERTDDMQTWYDADEDETFIRGLGFQEVDMFQYDLHDFSAFRVRVDFHEEE